MLKTVRCVQMQASFNYIRHKSFTSSEYCLNLVRSLDKENFLCTLLLPSSLREAAFAIRAFNAEVASVQDQVSQPRIGLMRMKFWEDCLDKIYAGGKVPNNPVAVELAKTVSRHKLSKHHLETLISSRMQQLDQPSFQSLRDMEVYADATCTTIFLLLIEASNLKAPGIGRVSSSIGKAQGLINLLRGVPHNASKRLLSLPSDLLAHHGVSEESVFRGSYGDSLNNVVRTVAEDAFLHLQQGRELKENVPVGIRSIFLPAVATARYIRSLSRNCFDVFDPNLRNSDIFLPISLYYHSIIKSF